MSAGRNQSDEAAGKLGFTSAELAAPEVKILSTGLAAGIIIDASVICGVLVPALVALLGRANWWLPRPAARLLHTRRSPPGWPTAHLGRPGR
jgi:putative drug exporter of the RND superfamily